MIAHRLQTIETADNLLYIENPKSVIGGQKGSPEYEEIMNKLKTETYKHQEEQVDGSSPEASPEKVGEDDGPVEHRP